jgi:ABC-type sugar transport system permease subunit
MNMKLTKKTKNGVTIFLFLFPLIFGVLVFQYFPLIAAAFNSMRSINTMTPNDAKFIGLENYVRLLQDTSFIRSIVNSIIYAAGKLFLQIPLAILFALIINRPIRGRIFLRMSLFAPLIASEVVICLLWNIIFFPDYGLVNSILAKIGLPTQGFIVSTSQALPTVLMASIWKDIGFTTLLILSGLQTIPEEYYEAARIDGAGGWSTFRFITIPLLMKTILIAAFMSTLAGFRIFTPIYMMTQGGPNNATISSIYYTYQQAFKFLDMGSASAMSVIFILILGIITLIESRVLRSDVEY